MFLAGGLMIGFGFGTGLGIFAAYPARLPGLLWRRSTAVAACTVGAVGIAMAVLFWPAP
jgi:hypothetical protein